VSRRSTPARTLTEAATIDADVRALTGRYVSHVVLTDKDFDHVLDSSGFAGVSVQAAPTVAVAVGDGTDADAVDRAIAAPRPAEHRVWATAIDLGGTTARVTTRDQDTPTTT
jgi:hypothetical protein